MPIPVLVPTAARDASDAGVTYHIQGELVPVLSVELKATSVYFEHHVLLWKDTSVEIGLKALSGAFKRLIAGLPILMTEARGLGSIAFSRDGAGHIFPIHLAPGQSIDVREHQFLAATDSAQYSFAMVKGVANIFLSGTGLWVDTFAARSAPAVVWLHGYGNVFEVELAPGEQIDIEPGAWIYKDPGVRMETQFQGLRSGLFGSAGRLFWNRFTGPGRIGLQSMSYIPPGSEGGTTKSAAGGLLGAAVDMLGG
ncbi:MAG: AIM24 family protein [Capsulimonadaceae bacterium]|nr:AIM24 family protein [Capsulimonadaceae bacterium]